MVDDLTDLSEALALVDKYNRLPSLLIGFVSTEPLRVYATAYQFGVMKITQSHMRLIHLQEEFKLTSATAYRRFIHPSLSLH